jgi:SAM-dependent MidA family methyltransferase
MDLSHLQPREDVQTLQQKWLGLVLKNELTDCLPEEMNRNETSPSSISVPPFF